MKKKWIQISCVVVMMLSVVVSACGCSSRYEDMQLTSDVKSVVCFDTEVYERDGFAAVQKFGLRLLEEQFEETNPVISPVSAYIALAMTGDGAEGNTRQQFLDLLGENGEMTLLSKEMLQHLSNQDVGLKVQLADSVWIDDEFEVYREWLANVESVYDAQVYQTDLKTDAVKGAMNEWISKQTNGQIKEMVENPFDPDVRLVLFNTVYFNGIWETEFKAMDTWDDYFHISRDELGKMPMMHQYGMHFDYLETLELEGCILPYENGAYAFVALIPKDESLNIRLCLEKLNAEDMKLMIEHKENCMMDLRLPKYEVEYGKQLNDVLKNMGLIDAFDGEAADFSKMGKTMTGRPICIDEVVQKAVIRVDERGTEAVAATKVVMSEESAMEPIEEPKKLYFNRPFFYMIMEMEQQIPLFMGIMDNPMLAIVE